MTTEYAYAKALQRAVESGKTPKAAVTALHEILTRRGRTALLPRIARAFTRIAAREHGKNTLMLSVAGTHATHAKKEAKEVLATLNMDTDDIETVTDESLIGGWRLEGKEYLVDASFKKHLLSIYNRAISS